MKRPLAFSAFFMIAAVCLAQQASPVSVATPDPAAPSPTPCMAGWEAAHVVIGKGGGRDLHARLDWPTNPPKTPMPAIISIHGGGWRNAAYEPNGARQFVSQGYFTMSCEYRTLPEAKWPAQIEDCKLAVRWLRANAAKYNVDPNRIGIWGGSAGGHLAALLGSAENHPELEGTGGYPDVSSKVQAVIDFFGPTDLRDGTYGLAQELFAKKYSEAPEVWTQASPITYVHKDMPPFLIVHGTKDPMVPYEQSKVFVEAMQKVGANVQFITVENGDHGLHAKPGEPPATPDWSYIFPQMTAFFEKHLKN
ncbi:MAG: alpha/beta hydrolase [Chthoniobacterales bacterium]